MEIRNQRDEAILDLVADDARFTKFSEFVRVAGMDKELSGGRNFTVFAPTDQAFSKLAQNQAIDLLKPENREELKKLVLLHVFPGKLSVEDLRKATAIKTEAGREIRIEVSPDLKDIKLANAKVVLPKAEATNGFIYPLDAVLQPSGTAAAAA